MIVTRLVFLRHGETAWNAEGRTMGQADIGLNRTGIGQALHVRAAIAQIAPSSAWCSPLWRCRQTARLALGVPRGLPLRILPGLAERDWGPWQGQPRALRPDFSECPEGAESHGDFLHRVAEALGEIDDQATPLIIAHSGVFRALSEVFGLGPCTHPIANALPQIVSRQVLA